MERPLPNPFARSTSPKYRGAIEAETLHQKISRVVRFGTESSVLDFKLKSYRDSNDARLEFLKDVSAFANNDGGLIIYGVRESRGVAVEIVGLENADSQLNKLQSWAIEHLQPNSNCLNIFTYHIDDKELLVASVSKSMTGPVYFTKDKGHSIWYRDHDHSRLIRIEELRKLLLQVPASRMKHRAEMLADEFRRSYFNGHELWGVAYFNLNSQCFGSVPDLQSYELIHTTRAQEMQILGMSSSPIRDAELIHYDEDAANAFSWEPGCWVSLSNELKPICIRTPPKSMLFFAAGTCRATYVKYGCLAREASRLIASCEPELIESVPSLVGYHSMGLRGSRKDWHTILAYSVMSNGPEYSLLGPSAFNEQYFEPKYPSSPFRVQLPSDLRVLSHRLLEDLCLHF